MVNSGDAMVLYYQVRAPCHFIGSHCVPGPAVGTYAITVTASGGPIPFTASNEIHLSPSAYGLELAWLPAANKWAFYRVRNETIERCW